MQLKFNINKNRILRFFIMLIAVIMMGFSLSLLVMTKFGTDPCSSMNYGISRLLHLSFGNYQVLFNVVLLVLMLLFFRSVIGFGTLGNMILVGYSSDFFTYIWHHICHIPKDLSFEVRVILLIPALAVFVLAAACYMNSGHGMAPYDALPFIIDETLTKKTGSKSHFQIIRYSQDFLCSLIGFLTGGEFGAITVLMVLTLAPAVQKVGEWMQQKLSITE